MKKSGQPKGPFASQSAQSGSGTRTAANETSFKYVLSGVNFWGRKCVKTVALSSAPPRAHFHAIPASKYYTTE